MADIEIPIDAGTSKRLLTAGKYCDKNILVTATGGSGGVELVNFIYNQLSSTDISVRAPSMSSIMYVENQDFKTSYSLGATLQVNKNSIVCVNDEFGSSFSIEGDAEVIAHYSPATLFFIKGDCVINASVDPTETISDTEAINIITGGEQI